CAPMPPITYGRQPEPISPKNQRAATSNCTLSHWWPARGELFLKSALLMPYSESTARFGLTQTPAPIPAKSEVFVVRALSGATTPKRGAKYQLLASWALATPTPPNPRAIRTNKVLRFIGDSPHS